MGNIKMPNEHFTLDESEFLPGKVTYNSFDISFDKPFEQQIFSLNEDLVQVEYENGYLIDIGWYPECDPKGKIILQLIHDNDWSNPAKTVSVTTLEALYEAIKQLTYHITKK